MTPDRASSPPRPSELGAFAGTVLVAAPHMDDEILACGGLLARLPDPARAHVVYSTDGMKSPAPIVPWHDAITPDLGARRRDESRAAAALLGLPPTNLHFLDLPEDELPRHRGPLGQRLRERIRALDPDCILLPFRYDRHPDHLEVNRAITAAKRDGAVRGELWEYFVYYRWRLLPTGDVRDYLRRELLVRLDIRDVAARKRAALDCFRTQTTRFYDWQTRPILRPELLDEECAQPEQFLRFDPALPGAHVFARPALVPWIRIAHRLEPFLQRSKYKLTAWAKRGLGRNA